MVGKGIRGVHALQGHLDKVWSVAFSPDGCTLVSGGEDRAVILWDTETYEERFGHQAHSGGVNTVTFSPKGDLIASAGEDGTVRVWHRALKAGWTQHLGHGGVNQVAFSPDGRFLVSVGGVCGERGRVRLWTVAGGREWATLDGHRDEVMTADFSPSGRFLLTGDFAGEVKLWDVALRQERLTIEAHLGTVWKVAFLDDDDVLLSGGEDGKLRFWFAPTGRLLSQLPGDTFGMLTFAVSRDRRIAIGRFDGEVSLWDLVGTRRGRTLGNHAAAVFSVAFSPDGSMVASAGTDHLVRLWQVGIRRPRPVPFARPAYVVPSRSGELPAMI
jgi:WD40 repeat protein